MAKQTEQHLNDDLSSRQIGSMTLGYIKDMCNSSDRQTDSNEDGQA